MSLSFLLITILLSAHLSRMLVCAKLLFYRKKPQLIRQYLVNIYIYYNNSQTVGASGRRGFYLNLFACAS